MGFRALVGADPAITAGEMVAVTGPSGSGETTIVNLIAGIDRPTDGTVTVNGSRLDQMTEERLGRPRFRALTWLNAACGGAGSGGPTQFMLDCPADPRR